MSPETLYLAAFAIGMIAVFTLPLYLALTLAAGYGKRQWVRFAAQHGLHHELDKDELLQVHGRYRGMGIQLRELQVGWQTARTRRSTLQLPEFELRISVTLSPPLVVDMPSLGLLAPHSPAPHPTLETPLRQLNAWDEVRRWCAIAGDRRRYLDAHEITVAVDSGTSPKDTLPRLDEIVELALLLRQRASASRVGAPALSTPPSYSPLASGMYGS